MNEDTGMSPYSRRPDASEHLARERRLFTYNCALENGDFEIVAAILEEAQADPELERLVLEINAAQVEEMRQTATAQDDAVLTGLLQKHFTLFDRTADAPGGDAQDEVELPPLTVGDVLARVRSGGDLALPAERSELAALQRQGDAAQPIPQDLSGRSVREFLARLGVTVSRRVENAFRNTAILLAQGRQQNMAQMAATRRQSSASKSAGSGSSRPANAAPHTDTPGDAAPPAPEQEPRS